MPEYVWVVRENSDKTEGRGRMVDVAICESEQEAFEANRDVSGTMGHPRHFAGEIYKIKTGTYPVEEEKVWGLRHRSWDKAWDSGWLDERDKPDPEDPEYKEYLRLRRKFQPTVDDILSDTED